MKNKKLYFIIPIVLLIFIGFTIFAVVNFKDDEEKLEGNKTQEVEDNNAEDNDSEDHESEEKDDDKEESDNKNDAESTKPTYYPEVVDHSYDDAKKLVDELQSLLGKADSLKALNNVRDSYSAEDIQKAIDAVTDKALKKELQAILDELSKVLDDTTAPKLNISDDTVYGSSLEVTSDDENAKITIIDSEGQVVKGKLKDGKYTVKAVDDAFNEVTAEITIDTTAPQVTGINNKAITKDNVTLKINDLTKTTVKVNGKEVKSLTFDDDGIYEVAVVDEAGNETNVAFTIDTTAPIIKGVEDGDITGKIVELALVDLTKTTVKVNGEETEDLTFAEDGIYEVEVIDEVENTSNITFTVDRTAPKVTGISDKGVTNENVTLEITDLTNTTVKINGVEYTPIRALTLSARAKVSGAAPKSLTFENEGNYDVEIIDGAKNVTEITFTIDRTKPVPTITVYSDVDLASEIKPGSVTNAQNIFLIVEWPEDVVSHFNGTSFWHNGFDMAATVGNPDPDNNNKYRVKLWTLDGQENEAKFVIYADAMKDKAGNTNDEITFTIKVDRKAPEITAEGGNVNITDVNNIVYSIYKKGETKILTDIDPKDNHARFNIGLMGAGEYIIEAVDLAGNSRKVEVKQETSSSEALTNIQEGDTVYLPNGNTDVSKLSGLPSGVTIIGGVNGKTSTIKGNFTINKENITLENVTVGGTLSVNSSNVTLNNVNATSTGSGALTIGKESDGQTYKNIVINGGNYKTTNANVQGEGALRIFNAEDISIHNLTLNGGIHLINYKGKTADISGNKIKYDYKGEAALVGILITTDSQGDYTAQQLYKNNKFDMDSLTNSYYVAIQGVDWQNKDVIQVGKYVEISSADELRKLSSNTSDYTGKRVVLTDDIDLSGEKWTPIDGRKLSGTIIDGDGHSIKNMTIEEKAEAGFIGFNSSNVIIRNITFDHANVKTTAVSQAYAGVVISKNYAAITLENVNVINSRVDNNWQAGGLVGFAEGNGPTFINCSIKNSFVGGKNSTAGTLFGLGIVNVTVNGCTAENVQLYTDGLTWDSTQKENNNFWVGHLYSGSLTVEDSIEKNVTVVGEQEPQESVANETSNSQEEQTTTNSQETTPSEPNLAISNSEIAIGPFPYLFQPFKVIKMGELIEESSLTITSADDIEFNEFLASSNYEPENVIWWAQFSCDTDKCEGFKKQGTDELTDIVVEGRRGDASMTMEAPKAKEGYTFVGWEKSIVDYCGMKIQGYEAIYEEVKAEEVKEVTQNTEPSEDEIIDNNINESDALDEVNPVEVQD